MRSLFTLLLLAVSSIGADAQSAEMQRPTRDASNWRVTLTVFRSPGTGVQVSKGNFAGFLAHYPTVIKRDGELENIQFVRMGVAWYAAPDESNSPYLSLSFAPSLSRGWSNSSIVDAGLRHMFTERISGQLGVAMLYAPGSRETRVNPTIGLGVRF